MNGLRPGRSAVLAGCLLLLAAEASVADAGATIVREGKIDGNLYAAGSRILVNGEVDGDAFVAGGTVTVERLVVGDVAAAGGSLEVRGNVTGDVRAAAGSVVMDGRVGGEVLAVGGTIRLGPGALVEKRALLAGGTVEVAGEVGRDLKAAAGIVLISGRIRGDAEVWARQVRLAPTAVIDGRLTYWSSGEADIDPRAEIAGGVKRSRPGLFPAAARMRRSLIFFSGFMFLWPLVLGALLLLLGPRFWVTTARLVGGEPAKTFALGLILVAAAPAAGIFLLLTIFGIPLAAAIFSLYPLVILLGFLTGVFFMGDTGARLLGRGQEISRGREVTAFTAALMILALLLTLPIVGKAAVFYLVCSGLGALALRAWRGHADGLGKRQKCACNGPGFSIK